MAQTVVGETRVDNDGTVDVLASIVLIVMVDGVEVNRASYDFSLSSGSGMSYTKAGGNPITCEVPSDAPAGSITATLEVVDRGTGALYDSHTTADSLGQVENASLSMSGTNVTLESA